jgi:hypothetical protein
MRVALLLLLAVGLVASPVPADAPPVVEVVAELAEERAVLPDSAAPDASRLPSRPVVADDARTARPDEPPPTPPPER